jgi:hypothetical protein
MRILVDKANAAAFFRSANRSCDAGRPSPYNENVKGVNHCVRTCMFGWQTI